MFMMRDFFLFSFYPTFLCSVFLGKDNFLISEKSIAFFKNYAENLVG